MAAAKMSQTTSKMKPNEAYPKVIRDIFPRFGSFGPPCPELFL